MLALPPSSIRDRKKFPAAICTTRLCFLKGEKGKTYKGLIGCLTAKSKVVCIEAVVPSEAKLDVKYLFDFLRKARGF